MTRWELPVSATIGGHEYAFRSDFRDILDLIAVFSDPYIPQDEKGIAALAMFYLEPEEIPPHKLQEAADYLEWFVNGGKDYQSTKPQPKLMDWEQDADLVAAPVNRVLGYECRSCEYLHWWTFLAAYMEVGDSTFAQVVSIRKKLRRGKKLEKYEREFYAQNRELVDFKVKPTEQEEELINEWIG